MKLGSRIRWSALVLALSALALATPASASTITVTNTADSGTGSLRQALGGANDGDLILLRPGTYSVTSGDLEVQDGITIRGAGARRTIVRSDGGSRVFNLSATQPVTIEGLTVTGGYEDSSNGGGLNSGSPLTLDSVVVRGNRANETAIEDGGGINAGSQLIIRNSLIQGNTAYNGGGIYSNGPTTIVDTTITQNTAGSPNNNGDGGGVQFNGATTVTASTLARNRSFNGDMSGGAVYGTATFVDSIVADNTAFEWNGMPAGSAGNPGIEDNCAGAQVDGGHNIEGVTDCGFDTATSRRGADPKLDALADNGGQTDTMALLAASPALDKGAVCSATDQRGVPRSLGGPCDIGAYELVRCAGITVNRVGTSGKDRLVGTSKADGILGLGGKDLLKGLAGNDALCGGAGRDRLLGGKGRDKLLGQAGRDRLIGGPGRDKLRGGPGRDIQHQ